METDLAVAGVETLRQDIAPIVARANAITVRTPDQRTEAVKFLKSVKGAHRRVTDFFAPLVEATHKAWKRTTEARTSVLDPLEAAECTVKTTVMTYDQEQEHIRLDEQRRLQAIADETARKERERLEKEAAKLKTPELREARLEQAAALIAPVVTIAEPEKPKGESTRKLWRARLTDKAALIQAAAQGNEIAATCLTFDQTAANKLATAMKGAVPVPGIEWYSETSLAMRGE